MKKKIKKIFSSILAIFLSALFITEVLPMQVMAESYSKWVDNNTYINNLIGNPTVAEEDTAEILYEVVEKRDEYTKVYKKSDGSYTALISKSPIHYLDNDVWEEINNSLITENGNFTNISNAFNVLFPTTISDDSQITIEANGSELAFSVNDICSSNGNVENSIAEYDTVIESAENALANTQSSVTYENAYNGTDIQYTVLPNAIKENIIVSSKNDLNDSYSFIIEIGELSYVLNDDGSIGFYDDSEVKFTIPKPVMTDSNYSFSYDIGVAVSNNNDGTIILTYTPSATWTNSNDRVYPINIDPAIIFESKGDDVIEDTVVCYNSDDSTVADNNGYTNGFTVLADTTIEDQTIKTEVYTKINTDAFKTLGDGVVFTNVQYLICSVSQGSRAFAKELTQSVDLQSVTYNTKPSLTNANIIDYYSAPHPLGEDTNASEFEMMHFDITETFNRWINGGTNNGFAVIPEEGFLSVVLLNGSFLSSNIGTILVFDFVYTNGYDSNYNYHSQDIGRAGTGYVNDFTRSLSLIRNDISLSGNIMPVSIDMIYNSASNKQWITSYNRYIEMPNDYQIVYFTETGSEIDFFPKLDDDGNIVNENDCVVFEDSNGYAIEIIDSEADFSFENFKITRPDGYIERFNKEGQLISVTNPDYANQHIDIVYDSADNIDYITDGVDRKFDYSYNSDGLLSEINCLSANGTQITAGSTTEPLKTTYTYDSNRNLTSVTFADGKSVAYAYNSNNKLVSAENIDNYKIAYTYDSLNKVTTVTEYAKNDDEYVSGNYIIYEALNSSQVKLADGTNESEIYQFDHAGKLMYTTDKYGNQFSNSSNGANSSYFVLSSGSSVNSTNLIINPSFERSSNWSGSAVLFTRESGENIRSGSYALKATRNGSSTTNFKYQNIAVSQSGEYTFSAYVKSEENSGNDSAALYLKATAFDSSNTQIATNSVKVNNIDGEWQRYYVTLNAPVGTTKIQVAVGFNNSIGTYYIDDVQLERACAPSSYNMIENGSFTDGTSYWTVSDSKSLSSDTIFEKSVKALNIIGGIDNTYTAYQTVSVDGKKDDVFSVGAWFKGNFVKSDPSNNTLINIIMSESSSQFNFTKDRYAQIEVSYQYSVKDDEGNSQTETDTVAIPFEQFITDWQFASNEIALKGDTNEITVLIRYSNNANDALITDVQLNKDEDAVAIDTTETVEEETQKCPCPACEEANCVCRCESEIACNCIQCKRGSSNVTDTFGNTTNTSSFDGTKSIITETAYTDNGNYVASATDTDNNTTLYNYNTLNGLLKSITDPNGNETAYVYDAYGLMTQVKLSNNIEKSANYCYTNDRLTSISNEGTTYNIAYNIWGNLSSVSVGSQPIITYCYGTGVYRGRLTSVAYGNGTEIVYYYDVAGNIVSVEIDGNETYAYIYDSTGNLTEITTTDCRTVRYTDGRTDIFDLNDNYIYSSYTNNDDEFIEVIGGVTYTTKDYDSSYDFTTGETIYKSDVTASNGKVISSTAKTDWFDRTTSESVSSGNTTITTQYGYSNYAENKTSNRVTYMTNRVAFGTDTSVQKNFYGFGYSYDDNGNITAEYARSASGSQSLRKTYVYDELNQLVRVNDVLAQTTYIYDYDMSGNILSKKKYLYTTDEVITDEPESVVNYTYDSGWGDRLSSYGNTNITYDEIGNPLTMGNSSFTWSGRQLTSYSSGNKVISYTYDENGLRSSKIVNDNGTITKYDYVWSDGKLISQSYTDSSNTYSAKFIYESNSAVQGFIYNNTTYLFVRNLQNDVIAVVDELGNEVLKINYDAWGVPSYTVGSLGNYTLLALFEKLNPFSYRGYCYDSDIGLYYLQSRYYSPEIGRFINTDDTNIAIQTQGDILGVNLFAYCKNEPVNNSDPNGCWAIAICADFAAAAVFGCFFNIGLCFDGKGNIGIAFTVGLSIVTNMYASASIGISWYPRYRSIFDLNGFSFTCGGAYAWGAYVGINGSVNISVDGVFSPTVTVSIGKSVSKAPFHIETRAGYTKIVAKTTIKQLCRSLKPYYIYNYNVGRYSFYIQRDGNNIITISSPRSRKKLLIYTKNNRVRFL